MPTKREGGGSKMAICWTTVEEMAIVNSTNRAHINIPPTHKPKLINIYDLRALYFRAQAAQGPRERVW